MVFGEALDVSGKLLGTSWWRLGGIARSLGDVFGALGGVLGALLDVLEVFWIASWAMICQDVDRNLRNTNTLEKQRENNVFDDVGARLEASWARLGRVLRNLVGALEASWGRFGSFCGASQKL